MSLPGPEWVLTTIPESIPIRTTDPSAGSASGACKTPNGRCTVGLLNFSSPAPGGRVTFQLSTHLAGAVFRLTYIDTEFIQPMMIAGGSLQSDVFYDGPCKAPECRPEGKINPTEAGAKRDAFTGKSTSRLLSYKITDTYVTTTVLAAYYGGGSPGGPYGSFPQPSDTKISKTIKYLGTPGEIEYAVTYEFSKKQTGALFEVLAGWIPNASSETFYAYTPRGGDKWYYWADANAKFGDGNDHIIAPAGLVTTTKDGERAWGIVPVMVPKQGSTQLKCLMRAGKDTTDNWKKIGISTHGNDKFPLDATTYTWKFRMFFGPLEDVAQKVRETVLRVAYADGPDYKASGF